MSHSSKSGRLSNDDSRRLVREYLEVLDCPRALTCWILFSSGQPEWVQLVNLQIDPDHYETIDSFRAAYAATKFLSKISDLKTGIDKAGVAMEAAVKAEVKCSETNSHLRSELRLCANTDRLQTILSVRAKVASILGPVPDLLSLPGGWSKGRTTSSSGLDLSPYKKYGSRLDVTASALRYAMRELRDSPMWGASALNADGPVSVLKESFTITQGNVMLTVPKNAKTDRVICYEPQMNIWLQLKVGNYMRRRLLRAGVDLDDQSINQRRALLGSKTGHLATLDLRAASDTVSVELIDQLLPIDWVCLLHDLRSKYTLWPDGQYRLNQKFSSMGNGFTFELESLLFYCICSSQSENVSVYGDDIIVSTEDFDACVENLMYFGFEINTSKSFSKGSFRESCGSDAWRGFSCTPSYLRRTPKCLEDVVQLHNSVLAMLTRFNWCESRYAALLIRWRRRFPHLLGPSGYGDGHYHTNLDEAMTTRVSWDRFGQCGWWFRSVVKDFAQGVSSESRSYTRYFQALCATTGPKRVRSLYSSDLHRRKYRYKRVWILAKNWPGVLWI